MKQPVYANHSHEVIMEALKQKGIQPKGPVMITADQYDKDWTVSVDFMSVGVRISKIDIDENEVSSIPEELGNRFIVNRVWHHKDT